jgi:beta-lactamase regulating signal transducer with metallopeptidase domain/protein involved in polysaccharide export with SLBB domain
MKDALALALVHFLWQGAALALIAAVLKRFVRNSAQARYAIGVATLCAMVAAPVATTMWLMQTPAQAADAPETSPVSPPTPTGVDAGVNTASGPATATDNDASRSAAAPVFPYATPVLLIWVLGVALLSARLTGGWLIAHRLATHDVRPVLDDLQQTARRLATQLKLSRPVRILESSAVAVPVMIGWLKPVVLLPAAAIAGLPADQLEALLAHELAHVRRHDYLVNLLQSLVETTLFYHPGVWWVSAQVRAEREHCCDDLAVSVTERVTYVTALTQVAALTAPGLALAASDGSLRGRVRRLLGPECDRRTGGAWLAVLPLVLVIAAAMPTSGKTEAVVPEPPSQPIAVVTPAPPMAELKISADTIVATGNVSAEKLKGLPLRISADSIHLIGNAVVLQPPPPPPSAAPTSVVTPQAPAQVKPGETVVINVEGRPELSGTYVVQPDGTIKLKGVANGTIEVNVSGAVRAPGRQRLPTGEAVVNRVLIAAGGYASNAGREVEIRRRGENGQMISILLSRDELEMNDDPGVRDGDIIHVPVGKFFFVNGEVNRSGQKSWSPGMTVTDAINLASGGTIRFSLGRSHIERPTKDKDGILKFQQIKDLKPETLILPGDVIVAGRKSM